ncbi:MAG: type I-E CRISPR-associated protein Cse1/CasA [Bacillota bacterium]|nr:type I-E CRISPR-associated protein Cse1/CasA [Bacillota bacterium]
MKATFNVLTNPWIPTLDQDGITKELSLLETLERAHELQGIQAASPLVEYSVHRFLILFLMDMIRPEDESAIEDLLEEGQFDPDLLSDYIDQCNREGVSFDLFDEERPFLQTPYVKAWDREAKPISTLDYTVPNGNNHIHFDHRRKESCYTPGKALRMLLAAQLFCTTGAQGYPSNVNGAPPWFALIQGENLFQTLVFGMIGTDAIPVPFDTPPVCWRNKEAVPPKEAVGKTSWLYGMLFPARRIHLLADESGETVSKVYFTQGLNYRETNTWTDPHVTYRITKNGRSNWKPNDDETIWRNLNNLVDGQNAPQILSQRKRLYVGSQEFHVVLYGVQTELGQMVYLRQQRHDLRLPVHLIGNEDAVKFISRYIALAKRLGKALFQSLNQEEVAKEIRLEAQQQFYGVCERKLWSLLETISQEGCDLNETYRQVVEELIQAAADHANQVLQNQTLRGRAMLALMKKQQSILQKECGKIRKEVMQ